MFDSAPHFPTFRTRFLRKFEFNFRVISWFSGSNTDVVLGSKSYALQIIE